MYESDEVIIRSSLGQFREFLESTVWTDIQRELSIWLEGVRDGLENIETDEKDLYRNQGRAEAVRYVLTLPETIKDSLEEQAQIKQDENKGE